MNPLDEYLAKNKLQPTGNTLDNYLEENKPQPQQSGNPLDEYLANQGSKILPYKTQVTQSFGTYNPIEPTTGNLSGDTNFAASENTPVSLPKGQWYIQTARNNANPQGSSGDYTNEGYGNDVIAQNTQTGEKLHFLHLAGTNVQSGDIVSGNTIVGMTGDSGNSTGPNLGVEYYDKNGKIGEVMQSPYRDAFAIQ